MVHSKHATAHISPTHDMTDGTEKMTFMALAMADGTAKTSWP